MGLAASQCRFLMLTSRESDIESKMMSLSNQQMALASRATRLSSEFAEAMSAQNVYFGENPLSYSDIMRQNLVEDAGGKIPQYIFKTARGSVVLSKSLADKIGLAPEDIGLTSGSSKDFKNKFPSRQDFIANAMGKEPEDFSTIKDADGNELKSLLQQSGYKYNDNIMNKAVVSVQSASVLNLSGYNFEALEYAMGTQEKDLGSYACIWTLDQYQYTEANVHSVVNMFVENATSKMAEQMLLPNNLGDSDAVVYAVNYAKEKTRQYYASQNIEETNADVENTMENLDKATCEQGFNPNATTSSTKIKVSEEDLDVTTTTGYNEQNQPQLEITHLTGKDIFLDTAQLTAVFLNYFDAGMLYAMCNAADNGLVETNNSEELKVKDSDYLFNVKKLAENIEKLNSKENENPLFLRLNSKLEGLGGFKGDLTGEIEGDEGEKKEQVPLIDMETGTTGWFGNTAQTNSSSTKASGTSTLVAQQNFYGYLYDALSTGGWSYNTSVGTDDAYLDTQIQHGNMYLCEYSSSNKDGRVLSLDDASSGLSLVDNADKIEKAQADFEAETMKIDYKTNIIETQMKTLQTELDSIQSEKESVKSITSKHLERRFNIFS